jgi:UDP:flavonoid glycosyltransferase YjiC (YdhE family)
MSMSAPLVTPLVGEASAPRGKPKKIAIQVIGTRGDVQPYIAIGVAAKTAGYEVTILTCEDHIPLVNENGLSCVGCFLNFEKLLKEDPMLASSMSDGDTLTFLKGMGAVWAKTAERHLKEWNEAVDDIKPDVIITGTLTQYYGLLAELHKKIPNIYTMLNCIPPNCKRMIFGFPNLPCGLNRRAVRLMMEKAIMDQFDGNDPTCQKLLGVKVLGGLTTMRSFYDIAANQQFGVLIGLSPELGKVLDPEPCKNWIYCGQFALSVDQQMEAAASYREKKAESGMFGKEGVTTTIQAFIDAGSRPVYMGWGSMTAKSPEYMVNLVAESARSAGVRAIVFVGWAKMNLDTLRKATQDASLIKYAEDNLLFVGKTPHSWLFPLCACVVHHGGAGTLTTGMKAGVPQIITPVFLDQWDHAYFVNQKGVGIGFEKTQLTNLTAKEISDAIKRVVGNAQMRRAAEDLKNAIENESGAERAVEYVEHFWTNAMQTGAYAKYIERVLAETKSSSSRCCG